MKWKGWTLDRFVALADQWYADTGNWPTHLRGESVVIDGETVTWQNVFSMCRHRTGRTLSTVLREQGKARKWTCVKPDRCRVCGADDFAPLPDGQRRCRPCTNRGKRDWLYGLMVGQYDAMVAAQGGKCALCGARPAHKRPLCVDHDHRTGFVRGALCVECNVVLGRLEADMLRPGDADSAWIERAEAYLERAAIAPPCGPPVRRIRFSPVKIECVTWSSALQDRALLYVAAPSGGP